MEKETKKKRGDFFKKLPGGKLPIKEQIFFVKRLSFLIKAGIPILESLHLIREQTKKKSYKKILDSIIDDVSNGQFLSSSLSKHRKVFGDFTINIIEFGESTGILSENLEYLAEELRKKQALKKKIVGAFIYPTMVIIITLIITGFLMLYLFPKITPIFQSLNAELPLSTRIVIWASHFGRSYGLLTIGILTVICISLSIIIKRNIKAHYIFDYYLLKLPIIGQIIRGYNLSNSTRTIGLLLKSGVTISDSLPILTKTTSNYVYKNEFHNLSNTVNRGERVSTYLKTKENLFPDIMSHIVFVGERSGNLSNSLIYLSEMYEIEVEDFTKNLSNLIEPALMVFMGLLVGFIAISIITPIYSITQHLTPK